MPRNLTANIGVETVTLPDETFPGPLRVTWTTEAGQMVFQRDVEDLAEPFDDVPEGTYSVVVQRLDSKGQPLGQPASTQYVVAPDTYEMPVSITITARPKAGDPA